VLAIDGASQWKRICSSLLPQLRLQNASRDGLADRSVEMFDKANCESYADLAEQLFSLEEHRGWNVQWLLY
jgi:hypothetical protein